MNRERIRELADVIEKLPHTEIDDASGFNMGNYVHVCGTPCCIAGWTVAVAKGWETITWRVAYYDVAANHLGLTGQQAEDLFRPFSHVRLQDVTPAHAAAVLRNLADTGVVDWSVGAPAAE